jgi:hypothetical protein
MTPRNPFHPHPPFCAVRPDDAFPGCGTVLVADLAPMPGEPIPAILTLPRRIVIQRAMDIAEKLKATPGSGDDRDLMIVNLLDAFILQRELISRFVCFELEDNCDPEEAAATLLVAQDVLRIGLIEGNEHPDVPKSIDLDVGHFFSEIEDDFCDDPTCPIHGTAPVPTDAEA